MCCSCPRSGSWSAKRTRRGLQLGRHCRNPHPGTPPASPVHASGRARSGPKPWSPGSVLLTVGHDHQDAACRPACIRERHSRSTASYRAWCPEGSHPGRRPVSRLSRGCVPQHVKPPAIGSGRGRPASVEQGQGDHQSGSGCGQLGYIAVDGRRSPPANAHRARAVEQDVDLARSERVLRGLEECWRGMSVSSGCTRITSRTSRPIVARGGPHRLATVAGLRLVGGIDLSTLSGCRFDCRAGNGGVQDWPPPQKAASLGLDGPFHFRGARCCDDGPNHFGRGTR